MGKKRTSLDATLRGGETKGAKPAPVATAATVTAAKLTTYGVASS
jgi:hypothetical protein